ncbi:hypothetical protein TAMA11512_13190 [Selenomonas sp. TAMA-11512]|uniref:type II toxin-antitoxin system MqsA family antitoxin n=1 Tax=Selenomonas sp. TAMA-11512 TaxID=3095337 RepID=UPI00308CBBFA|nr:hypothetical protein TAMA11512_13190 [Selenomonas sp. TAMA-11512]
MNKCTFCKGSTREGLSTFTVEIDSSVVVIRNVPSMICEQCGEIYYTTEVMTRMYQIAQLVKDSMSEVAIVNYHPAA